VRWGRRAATTAAPMKIHDDFWFKADDIWADEIVESTR
jgi:hypothetical protein